MKEFAIRQADINPDRKNLPQVMVLGAHTDDDAMFKLTTALNKQGVGITVATLTNSDARNLPAYSPEELSEVHWKEAQVSGKAGGITEVRRIEIPDGKLKDYIGEGIGFAGNLIDEIKPIALVTPHKFDAHIDHASASEIGKLISGERTPHYMTDTLNGFSKNGSFLVPDIYVPLSEEEVLKENEIYLANSSQVVGLPDPEMRDVKAVLDMNKRRGGEVDEFPYAAVIFRAGNTRETPLEDILEERYDA